MKILNKNNVKNEIDYIVNYLKTYKNKWSRENFVIINNNTIEDNAIIEICKNNNLQLNFIKTFEELDNNSILLNTDNYLMHNTKINYLKTNYTINIFIDYSEEDLKEILEYYKIDFSNFATANYGLDPELLAIYVDYMNGNYKLDSIAPENRKKLIKFLQEKNKNTNISLINSIHSKEIIE